MQPFDIFEIHTVHLQDIMREAEHLRLVKQAQANQPSASLSGSRLAAGIARQLARFSRQFQKAYESATHLSRKDNPARDHV